ncbi:MAG: hypothetical protein JWO38_3838 [Gemmataceae bacterium]|nr:hypothetical protein [Gemmataceae bacterium]
MTHLFAVSPLFAELSLRGWFPVWLAFLLGIAAVAAVGVLYVREAGRLGFAPRSTMAMIRITIVVVVAFLLLRPVWVREYKGEKRRPVAVLVDVSQSMASKDPRPGAGDQWRVAIAYDFVAPDKGIPDMPITSVIGDGKLPDKPQRIEVARAALTNPKLSFFGRLRDKSGPLEVSTFGSRRAGQEGVDNKWLKELAATEPRTALCDAVNELIGRDPNDLPAAVVLVTDGRENASRASLDDIARECARLKVPLHVYGVGSSAYGHVQLRDAAVPDVLFVDDLVSVPVRYRVKGVTDGRAEIVLKYGDREVARKVIDPVREGDDLREVLSFVPSKQDAEARKQELTVTVRVTSGAGVTAEVLTDETTKAVKVVDRKLKVLLVDSLPRFDFKFLQRALLRDRRVEARFYLTEGDRTTMKSGKPWVPGFAFGRDEFRKELFEYDLLILGDVPATFWTPEQQEVVKDFVAEGGGLIHLAGRWHAPAGWLKSPIADVLPVEFAAVRFPIESPQRPTPFRPQVVPAAGRSAVLALEDDPLDNARLWRTLPEVYWHYPVTKLKPAAEVFLAHPREKLADGKPMPLLAGHYYGKGYVLFVGFDETWRWRLNEGDKFFGRFWSQAVYVAGVPRTVGTKLTQLSLDTTDPIQGKTGQLYARLFTKDFQPVTAEEIEARLVKVDADPNDKDTNVPVKLVAIRGPDNKPTGEYVATLPFNRTGRFSLKVDPNNGNPAALDYRVNLPPEHELAPGGMAEGEMRKLAEASGGKFYREEDLVKLADQVKPQYTPYSVRTETVLWNRWALFLLVGLMTLEWIVRKLNGLS